jgi:NTP pyrophosphatase (non-canonical NTP hydrolase)
MMKNKITKHNDIWETDEFIYGVNVLVSEKPLDKIICKAVEELNELAVKLLQYINKPESISDGDIEEEIADVEMHLKLLKHYFPVSKEIRTQKIEKFLNSKDYNIYREKFENN